MKRYTVMGFTVLLLMVLGGLNAYLYRIEASGTPDYLAWARSTLASVTLLVAFVWFLKWMNNWADRHATEEFRLKRMLLDVRRANLLIETALEWETESEQKKIPDQLLEILSRNLFMDRGADGEATPPVESLVSLIVAKQESLRVKNAVAEFEAKSEGKTEKK